MPLIEAELRTWLLTELPSLSASNITYGLMPDPNSTSGVPVKTATIYSLGGESELRFRFRVITRDRIYGDAMTLANDIYNVLQRLHATNLTTYRIYICSGQKPQSIGRDEAGAFLTSADYLLEFTLI